MKQSNLGFSMIEVLVAVLVVSFGMLGIAAALFTATRSATSNYVRQQAVQNAYDILDRMRANRTVAEVAGGSYTATATPPASSPGTNCATSACSGAAMAAYDIWQWQTQLANTLPQGLGSVTIANGNNQSYTVTIQVSWSDQAGSAAFTPTGTVSSTPITFKVISAL